MNTQTFPALSLSGRTHYRSSGDINFANFILWLIPALVVAGILAALMYWLFHVGHYYIIIVPAFCALAVAGMARLAVAQGHCRNKIVAGLMGAGLGILLYLGTYYVGMVSTFGAEVAARPDFLVQYIRLRLATDVMRDTHGGRDDETNPDRSNAQWLNWGRFGVEFLMVVGIIATAATRRAGKTYCEQCHRWMVRETTPFDPLQTEAILGCLDRHAARDLAALCHAAPYATVPNLTMAVEYCPTLKAGATRDCPVFLSLKNVTANPQGVTFDAFEQAKGKIITQRVELNRDELPALAARFPAFTSYVGAAAVAAVAPKPEIALSAGSIAPRNDLAQITLLPPEHCGKVLTRAMMVKGNLYSAIGLVGLFGGLMLLAWGATRLEEAEKAHVNGDALGVGLCVAGGLGVLFAIGGIFVDSSFGGNRMLRKAFFAAVDRRDDAIVDPADPAARFVEIVPKLNWNKTMLDNASDIGLLVADPVRNEIRFEGDRERWRLPAASITNATLEHYVHGNGAGKTKMFYVVLRANRADGFWEAPIRERHATGLFASKRKKIAAKLHADIQAIFSSPS
jgi:hypothetical protein